MFCANCGTKLPDEALFCPTCGNRSPRMNQSPPPSQPEPQSQPQPQPQPQAQPQPQSQPQTGPQAQSQTPQQPGPQAQSQTQTPPRQETSAAAGQSGVKAAPAPVHRHFPFGTIVAVAVLAVAAWLLFHNGLNDPVRDLKKTTFDELSSTYTLGEAVAKNTSNAEWKSEKKSTGSYIVTLDCVENMYDISLTVTFSVTYTDDWVYIEPTSASFSGDSYTDSITTTAAMMLLYGQLDEQSLLGLMAYGILWDVLG